MSQQQLSYIEVEHFNPDSKLEEWLATAKVSKKSLFNDNIWYLDSLTSRTLSRNLINWGKIKNHNIETIKRVLFFTKTNINGIKNYKALTLGNVFQNFIYLTRWMKKKHIVNFSQITKNVLKEYEKDIQLKQVKDPRGYYVPLKLLVEYKDFLEDKINLAPSDFKKVQVKKSSYTQTSPISKVLLEKLLPQLFKVLDELQNKNKSEIEKYFIDNLAVQKSQLNVLNSLCYFVIAIYTGMRVSEILSLKKSCFEISEDIVTLNGTLFKMTSSDSGKESKWTLGIDNKNNYALKAIKILQKISPEEFDSLFFLYDKQNFKPLYIDLINRHLREMLKIFNVDEKITTHQFRRTFAKLVGTVDKTNLLALQQHLKHVSINMTSYYVGSDLELLELIGNEKQNEIAQGLNEILSSSKLAGKLGEKIASSNLKFRGKAGEQLRNDYISSLMAESDLIIMPHEYGFCIYQPEQAQCQGESKKIGLNTCIKCNNFAVSKSNKVFWIKRVKDYTSFKEDISEIPNQTDTVKELDYQIEQAKKIINNLGEKNEETFSEQSR